MQVAEMETRPPYVQFEQRAVKDNEKTMETGIYSYKDEIFVMVTPAGSRDIFESNAESWLKKQEANVRAGRLPEQHLDYFKRAYERFKEGLEVPDEGTPIKGWSAISPAQQAQVLQANIRTVEDLAAASEDGLTLIGMGARALKQKAEAWLQSSEIGKPAGQIQDLQNRLAESERQKEQQAETIQQLVARVEAMESGTDGLEVPPLNETTGPPRNKDGSIRKKPGPKSKG